MNSIELNSITKNIDEKYLDALYRVIYLHPNAYSDEQIAVGVALSANNEIYFSNISTSLAYERLNALLGKNAQEQTILALKTLRQYMNANHGIGINNLISPTDLLHLGPTSHAKCDNPHQFSHDLLEISSSLYQNYHCKTADHGSISQEAVIGSLYDSVTQLNALKATQLFRGEKISLSREASIKVPILGDHIVGGPISLVAKKIELAKNIAEASIARYSLAGKVIKKKAAIYILAPSRGFKTNQPKLESSLFELKAIADGLGVLFRYERNLSELAHALLSDEEEAA